LAPIDIPDFVIWFQITMPSGVEGNFVDKRIMATANSFVRFSRFFEKSLLSILKILGTLVHFTL